MKNVKPEPFIIDCDDYIIEDKWSFLQFIEKMTKREYKLFPMVFYNGEFIGGFYETKEFYDKEMSFFENSDF